MTLNESEAPVAVAPVNVHSGAPVEKSSVKADQHRIHTPAREQLAPRAQPVPDVHVVGQVVWLPVQEKRPHVVPEGAATHRPRCALELQTSHAAGQGFSQQT